MAKYMTTPNILWKIENFHSVPKMHGPTIKFMGRKFYLSYLHCIKAKHIDLYISLDNLSTPEESKHREFCVEAFISGRNIVSRGVYSLTNSEWCIWSNCIQRIHAYIGKTADITFVVMILPGEDLATLLNTGEAVGESDEVTPCSLQLMEDIASLFNNAERSDFTVTCGDRKFFVHKAILSARSTFFAAMFRCDIKETNEKEGKIEEMDPHILEIVLRYLYTGKLPTLHTSDVQKVHAAADRFCLEPLKIKCHSSFIDSFTNEPEIHSGKGEETEDNVLQESPEKVTNDSKERQMLKRLFMTKEWRIFSDAFPDKAFEMCKQFFDN